MKAKFSTDENKKKPVVLERENIDEMKAAMDLFMIFANVVGEQAVLDHAKKVLDMIDGLPPYNEIGVDIGWDGSEKCAVLMISLMLNDEDTGAVRLARYYPDEQVFRGDYFNTKITGVDNAPSNITH